MGKIIKGALVGGIIMLVMGVLVQLIPWGYASIDYFENPSAISQTIESQAQEGIYIISEDVFSFIVVSDPEWDSIPRKLLFDLLTQILLAGVITAVLLKTQNLHSRERIGIVALMAIAAGLGAIMPDWNWWGFSLRYVVGASVNLVIVWTATAYILVHYILKER